MRIICRFLLLVLLGSSGMDVLHSQWAQTNGPYGGPISSLAVSGTSLFAGTFNEGVFRSSDEGTSWAPVNSGLSCLKIGPLVAAGAYLFAATSDCGVYRSSDMGLSWREAGLQGTYIIDLTVSDSNLIAGTQSGIYLSADLGTNWVPANNGLPKWLYDTTSYAVISAVISRGRKLYAGTGVGEILVSTNNGLCWSRVSTDSIPPACFRISSFAVSGTNLFAGLDMNMRPWAIILRSVDNGTTWTCPNKLVITDSGWTLPGSAFLPTIHALEAIGTNVFAATDGGVYLSTNNGTSWTPINEGLPKPTYDSTQPIPVWCLAIGATDLFAGTYDGGVCKRPLAQMITSAQPLATVSPQGFCLEQNYPNPFNPKTGIRVQGSGNRDMRLVVYDLLGREVAVLANGKYPAGEHTFTFDGTNLASGVYMYRLTAGAFSAVRRMLLVR